MYSDFFMMTVVFPLSAGNTMISSFFNFHIAGWFSVSVQHFLQNKTQFVGRHMYIVHKSNGNPLVMRCVMMEDYHLTIHVPLCKQDSCDEVEQLLQHTSLVES